MKTRDQFNQPKMCKEDNFIDNLIRGMLNQELEARDVNFVEDVRDHLFDTSEGGVNGGKDLVAISIQVITLFTLLLNSLPWGIFIYTIAKINPNNSGQISMYNRNNTDPLRLILALEFFSQGSLFRSNDVRLICVIINLGKVSINVRQGSGHLMLWPCSCRISYH